MNISRKIVLTGVVTLGVFALGSAGAAVAHTLTIVDRAGVVQHIAPVTTGTTSNSPSTSPFDDKSNDPTGTTTVAPAPPINIDDDSDVSQSGTDSGATHDSGSDNENDGSAHNTGGSGDSGSGSTSGSGASEDNGSSSDSGHDDGSGDTGGHQ